MREGEVPLTLNFLTDFSAPFLLLPLPAGSSFLALLVFPVPSQEVCRQNYRKPTEGKRLEEKRSGIVVVRRRWGLGGGPKSCLSTPQAGSSVCVRRAGHQDDGEYDSDVIVWCVCVRGSHGRWQVHGGEG